MSLGATEKGCWWGGASGSKAGGRQYLGWWAEMLQTLTLAPRAVGCLPDLLPKPLPLAPKLGAWRRVGLGSEKARKVVKSSPSMAREPEFQFHAYCPSVMSPWAND